MALTRVTEGMTSRQSVGVMPSGLSRLATPQEQLSTGRVLDRPSYSPADTTSAMRIRSRLADAKQYARNAADGDAWLGQIDSALTAATDQVRRARDLALRGANQRATGPGAREALATAVDQIRQGVLTTANASYLGRPVFGGVTAGSVAYDASGTYVGVPGAVNRTVADGVQVQVSVDGATAFGSRGSTVFDHLTALAAALRAGDRAGISAGIGALAGALDRLTRTQAEVATRQERVKAAQQSAGDNELELTGSLSDIEDADLPRTLVDLQLQQVAYRSALGATARVMQPSLLDFLR
jgi:flagellar hook-associated protein 3 FlgL